MTTHKYSLQYTNIVNKALIMNRRKGVQAAKSLMMRAGLPLEIINTVLIEDEKIVNKLNTNALVQETIQR